jgi:HK97 family phage major capsid protein
MISASDPDGGYTVPTAMSNKIIKRLYEIDPLRSLAAVESITTGAIEWLVDNGDAGSGWEGNETVATTSVTTPQIGKKRIPVNTLATRPRISQILLEDSGINIEQFLANKVADRFGRDEAAAFVSGDGINKPRGFLTYANGTAWGTIEQINMGAAANLTADGFISIKYHMIEQYLNSGTWLMNRSTVQAALQLKDGAGNYLWQPSFMAGQPSTILGLPVRMSTSMPAVTANTLSVALGAFKEAYMIVDRLGITVQRDPYTDKPLVEMYFRKRVGGDVTNFDAIKIGVIAA